MHHANYYYGHAHLLARYAQLDDWMHPPRMQGYLQHGWNIGDGMAPGVPFVDGSRLLVWSDQLRRRAWSQGRRDVIAVGSPFAYLLEMDETPVDESKRDGTIFYPFHGWEGQEVMGDHQRLIDEIKAHETGPLTVCLYWNEHKVKAIRRLYEKAGFRVICHGYRGFWWRDHDRDFLVRQLAELRRHKRVVSNRLCSAIWYGLLAGAQGAVYGDPMVLENADPTFGGEPRLRRQWPEVYGYDPDPIAARKVAEVELGADILCTPEELRTHLGWPVATQPLKQWRPAGSLTA
ncbi:hypothetical protein M1L60_18020 [Actinoplanes sp. TRM 88003]|uniref:Amidohydrolase-related domain-containing protein n=1 Tax=Paractinoplanes aksuensis TaxID=2939490 RepID=A0ABT1DNU7_9ACTN|nr:hypothetical protein [Actinoplanes aksuensis]MCO8272495.1 hypothetical protein [Actinoplanes aksuensis]